MLLQAGEQTERLQAVDAELFEEVIVWRQALPRDFKLRGCQLQNFIQSLSLRLQYLLLGCSVPAYASLRQVRLSVGTLDKFLQSSSNCRLREQLAENFHLPPQ